MTQITAEQFRAVLAALGEQGADDVAWSESIAPPATADDFAQEAIFVICNSGMKNTVAKMIFDRSMGALAAGTPVIDVFKHKGKAAAIEAIWADRDVLLSMYRACTTEALRIELLVALPWVGHITKYHLAKNFGMNVAKPDVHLQRLATREGCTAQALCERLAVEVGLRAATVDVVLWRACANGVINSRTGEIAA
ncbi:hypothetical protein SAMN05518669_103378 [Variovorax sp. YR634]|uniref:hypothetical protein n=1 Tax=Variovorax sp. YR634 TaxID=1884385 RepID=UPI0008994656|nr:hypothetical protein [Variovorax sp. YR634]SDX13819.1 hypothetical protein SAMN05518669_103378 [Variovorax sp. YR634]